MEKLEAKRKREIKRAEIEHKKNDNRERSKRHRANK